MLRVVPNLEGWLAYCEERDAKVEARRCQERDASNGDEYFEFVCNACHSILLTFCRKHPILPVPVQ